MVLCAGLFRLYRELMYSTTSIIHCFSLTSISPTCFPPQGTERCLHQYSVVCTWMEDRLFPILWNSGVMNMSVRLLHTTWTDGRSITKLWITGITNLEGQGQKVTSEEMLRKMLSDCAINEAIILFLYVCLDYILTPNLHLLEDDWGSDLQIFIKHHQCSSALFSDLMSWSSGGNAAGVITEM